MKSIFKIAFLLLLATQFISCSDDNETSAHDVQVKSITTGAWGMPTVTSSDGDLTDDYANFVIVFTASSSGDYDGTFVVSNGGYAFTETSGKWKFNDALTGIQFDSGKEMEYELADEQLTLHFTVADPGGRREGLSGQFTFELQRM